MGRRITRLLMILIAIVLICPFTAIVEEDEDPEAALHEAQIISNAQEIYDGLIRKHGSVNGYINYIAQQKRYYESTLAEAEYYNVVYKDILSWSSTCAKVGISVLKGSPSKALKSVADKYYTQFFLKEITKELPKMSTTSFVYSQADAGLSNIGYAALWEIMDRTADNNGSFVDVDDATDFIVEYYELKTAFVSTELGRQYYYDQLNQSPWDTLGEIAKNVAVSEVSKLFCRSDIWLESVYLKGYAIEQMYNYLDLVVQVYKNEHLITWRDDLIKLQKEMTDLLEYHPSSGSSTIPSLPVHTVTFDSNGGSIGTSKRLVYEGETYGFMPSAFRLGYDLTGWYDDPEGGNKVEATDVYQLTTDQTLYAHWSRIILESGWCGDTLTYVLYGDGLLEITGSGEMTDAPWINQYADRVGEVSLPIGLTSIGAYAFDGCTYLHELHIPENVSCIGEFAFANSGLVDLSLPDNLTTIGEGVLSGNTGVKEITVPGTVTEMGWHGYNRQGVFTDSSVEKVVFEEGITKIGYCCMCNATHLRTVELPSTLKIIEGEAFSWTVLEALTIPDGVVEYGSMILSGNETITTLTIPGGVEYGSSVLVGSSVIELTFADGVTNIPNEFCKDAEKLSSVIIPETVISIGDEAFTNTGLTTLTLPSDLQYLGYKFLSGNTGVKEVRVPGTVIEMGGHSYFRYGVFTDSSVERITFEEGITKIGYCCMCNATHLKTVELPSTLKTIEGEAFSGTVLETLTIPDGVEEYGSMILSGNETITTLTIPVGVELGYSVLAGSSITELTYADGVTKIPAEFCKDAEKLNSVIIPETVISISDEAFANTGLTTLTLPSDLQYLGYSILSGNTGVKEVTVPGTVETMDCHGYYGRGVFTDSAVERVVFSEGVTVIGNYACNEAEQLLTVELPSTLEIIASWAFSGNNNLSTVKYNSTSEDWAQVSIESDNDSLTALMITFIDGVQEPDFILPASMTVIEEEAFANCAFTYVVLPEDVSSIASHAFADCKNLRHIYIPPKTYPIAKDAFDGVQSGLVIHGVKDSYAEDYAGKYGFRFKAVDE